MTLSALTPPVGGYHIRLPVYEGPLDLLLALIERAELDITSVSLARVTDQYLDYIRSLREVNPEEVSAFLVIASKLIQIKSEALLPRPPQREPGEEDIGEALARQLRMYKRFKEVAEWLLEREKAGLRTYLRVAAPPKIDSRLDTTGLTLQTLLEAAKEVYEKAQEQQALGTVIRAPKVTIREKIRVITRLLSQKERTTFEEMVAGAKSRLEIVVTFLALLELVKRYRVLARQEGLFSSIQVDAAGEFQDEEEFELEFE